MENTINKIVELNKKLFGSNPSIKKVNAGFTNTIYIINDKYVVKICSNSNNENKFLKEINFYKSNTNNDLIPKLYYADSSKKDVSYFYEIIEKVEGVTLFNIWHTLDEEKRENVIKQLCDAMKMFHSNKVDSYDWIKRTSEIFLEFYYKAKNMDLFNADELKIIDLAYTKFPLYLESHDFVLVHNDLHFDNILYNNGNIKLIDFERAVYAPIDFELDIIYRMIRKPWKFASEEEEQYTKKEDYENIMKYIEKYYPDIINIHNLYKRLAIYDIVYYLKQYINYPKLDELKEDIMSAARKVVE